MWGQYYIFIWIYISLVFTFLSTADDLVSSSGSFYDFSQSYDLAFYLSGACMMAGSLLLLFLTAILPQKETPPLPPPETELISCTVTTATDTTSTVT